MDDVAATTVASLAPPPNPPAELPAGTQPASVPLPPPAPRLPPSFLALLALIGLTLLGASPLVVGGITAGIDNLDFFYPMFSFLGEQLRGGNIPGWNPYQFAGAPFAADPESGWTYLPAMAIFAALPLEPAARTLMLFHFLLAALGMGALARVLGMTLPGALAAAFAYAFSHFFYSRSVCCPAHIVVLTWIPATLLCATLAARATIWLSRLLWWALAGLALSQILAGWLGQGSYYALLLLAGFVTWRELFTPPRPAWPLPRRLGRAAISLAAILAWAAGFAAAGVLPRVEYYLASNLGTGYAGIAATQGGLEPVDAVTFPFFFGGPSVVILALLALPLARRRYQTPFFALVAVVALILALRETTPLHTAAYALLPRFEGLHRHSSERIFLVLFPAIALLVGATVSAAARWRLLPAALLTLVVAVQAAATLVFPLPTSRRLDLDQFYSPAGAAAFLRSQERGEPFRYFGYDPEIITPHRESGQAIRYIWHMFDPRVTALLVNNRGTMLRLQDIQGYNPLQLQRYVEFIDALNGEPQEYHGRYVLPSGLDSPLLDLLNARFVVVPAALPAGRADLLTLRETHPLVYEDDLVAVLENRDALPRAWVVHEARQVAPGAALPLLASGAVDPRQTALLETAPPPLAASADASRETVTIERYAPDAIRLRARSDAPGLLVLSEIFYPAWQAYVDGKPAPLYVANHALRAVPLPAGEHTVELRYESATLRAGLLVTLVTLLAFGALLIALSGRSLRRRDIDRLPLAADSHGGAP